MLVTEWGLSRTGFLVAMMVLLFLLGLVLESFSIILLTMPAILPLLAQLDIDKVWYGILLTLSLEMALISPPEGINLFILQNLVAVLQFHDAKQMARGLIVLRLFNNGQTLRCRRNEHGEADAEDGQRHHHLDQREAPTSSRFQVPSSGPGEDGLLLLLLKQSLQ